MFSRILFFTVIGTVICLDTVDQADLFERLVPGFKDQFIARQNQLFDNFTPEQRKAIMNIAKSNQTDVGKVQQAVEDPQILNMLLQNARDIMRENNVTEGLIEFMTEIMRQGLLHADINSKTTRQAAQVAIEVVPKWVVQYNKLNAEEKQN
ncbi:unnamed protein product [Bursaphelenchus okinawaensis]|uniref:Uncharacterized protein n=1 Tax=Bursaphelenchus okinawaensis TaxID=465554 RepID=A0A811LRB6_9BILA|nr:unnamed protein product [Bursaphelenchus okinawaensis]CAG9128102.1 unnamed protein product [Bursaphelenchus okinawaensis]